MGGGAPVTTGISIIPVVEQPGVDSSSDNTSIILIAVLVPLFVILAICGVLAFLLLKRKKKAKPDIFSLELVSANGSYEASGPPPTTLDE